MPRGAQISRRRRGIAEDSTFFKEFNRFSRKIREKINELRAQQGLTQEQMEEFEINLRQFQRIESGDTKNITLANLFKIAKALGVKPAKLIDV